MASARPGQVGKQTGKLAAVAAPMGPLGRARSLIPAWVPAGLESEYRAIALRDGEEDAARWARRMKREMEGTPGAPPSRRPVVTR